MHAWYKQEYDRHLNTDFYKRVGTVADVHKKACRKSLALILKKFMGLLTRKDFLSFNLGTNLAPVGRKMVNS